MCVCVCVCVCIRIHVYIYYIHSNPPTSTASSSARLTRLRGAEGGNVLVNLGARELPALTRLCALRQLDLNLLSVHEILCRDPEPPRRHLHTSG